MATTIFRRLALSTSGAGSTPHREKKLAQAAATSARVPSG